LELTDSGHKIIQKIMPCFRTRQDAMRNALTINEQKHFDTLLNKIVHAMPNWIDIDPTQPLD